MRFAWLAMLIGASTVVTGCTSTSGEWGTALERGAAYAAAEASAVEPGHVPAAAAVATAHYDASVGLWQCRLTDGSLRYSRSECLAPPGSR